MRFIIDENIRNEVKTFLTSCGHNILNVIPGSQDRTIAELAKETKRVILTCDRHFADILMYNPKEYSGIIRIKIHPPDAPTIIAALKDFLLKFSYEEITGKLVILEKDGFRIR